MNRPTCGHAIPEWRDDDFCSEQCEMEFVVSTNTPC